MRPRTPRTKFIEKLPNIRDEKCTTVETRCTSYTSSFALDTLSIILLILWRKKVALCATLVKEASVVIKDRPLHICFPFFTLVGTIINLSYFVIGMLFLSTAELTAAHFSGAAMLTSHSTFAQIRAAMNETIQAAGGGAAGAAAVLPSGLLTVQNGAYIYFLFGFLWTNAFINALAWTSLSVCRAEGSNPPARRAAHLGRCECCLG